MQAHRIRVTVPEDHQLEIRLPRDFPAGPAEIIVLAGPPASEAREAREGTQVRGSGELLAALENLKSMERTDEEERVLEDFDRFRQANPFDLASLVDEDR